MNIKTFKYRIYPTKKQKDLIAQHFGCTRFVWNYYLRERQDYYTVNKEEIEAKRVKGSLNYYDNAKHLTQMKKENAWLKEVNSQSLQATLKHLDGAYRNFFQQRAKFPKYKSKKSDHSFHIPQNIYI